MKNYKADSKANVYQNLLVIIVLGVAILFSSKFDSYSWIFFSVTVLTFAVLNILTLRLNEIQLDKLNSCLTLIYKSSIGAEKTIAYDLKEIEFTYKRSATSFRSGVKNVCTVYCCNKQMERIASTHDWSDIEIERFVHGLIESGVRKKFIGYSLKDVEI